MRDEWQDDPDLRELEMLEEEERRQTSNQTPTPSAMPQSYVDQLFQNALAEMERWVSEYEQYRMQGRFAQLEPIFQITTQLTGR
jgi:hypothetical protein